MVVPDRADVVVVGGGPAGSSAATHLARAGLDVLLFDKARFPREKACAEYCSPGVVDALEDLGVLDSVRAGESRDLPAMRISAANQEIPLDFSSDRPKGNQALGIKRSVLDQHLLEFARQDGVRVFEGTRVCALIIDGNRVTGVRVKDGDHESTVSCEFVVAADGLHSTVVRHLNLDRPVHWPRRLGLVARYRHSGTFEEIGQMHVGDDIYCGLSPVCETDVNVSLVVPMGSKPHGIQTAEFFERTLDQLPGIVRALTGAERITRVRGLGPMGKRVRATSGNGFLLVGDAAGFFDPLTGEGVHRALRGGELAARSVLGTLDRRDRFPAGYDEARVDSFQDKERVCQIIQMMLLSGRVVRYAADRASGRDRVREILTGILGDYAPARRALTAGFLWSLFKP